VNNELVRALAGDATRQLAVGDQSSTRTVYAVILALVAIGVVLIFIGAWIFRQTKPDPELLAPLERMADRSWRQQDPEQKRQMLDEARPDVEKPVLREKNVPEVDQDFALLKPSIGNFDDLAAEQDAERRRAAQDDPMMPEKLGADDGSDDDTGEIAAHEEGSTLQDDK
jgi:hypothetical protein